MTSKHDQTDAMRKLLPELKAALQSFTSSSSTFRIVRTVHPPSHHSSPPAPSQQPPKTLCILDSSFNPPSIAHLALATSALHRTGSITPAPPYPHPWRLLLLFSTHNADKAASAASFEQRLALMTLFAQDLQDTLSSSPASRDDATSTEPVSIDIGLTTQPYYNDKSAAISREAPSYCAPHARHIHLCGFDTLTRIFAPKYYPHSRPPLAALEPFFERHGLRVMIRPGDEFGDERAQMRFWEGLRDGEMEGKGGKREWAGKIEMVRGQEGVGVSSTRVRRAAKRGEWETVEGLCTGMVGKWVRGEGLYEGDDRGSKMA